MAMSSVQMQPDRKRGIVFDAAANVFVRYGFRRTSMNDIAEAAGISRPALYLLFENKEDLFRQLASHRQNEAIEAAAGILEGDAPFARRFMAAILEYERIYYEPVCDSPHGEEFMDINLSVAGDDMRANTARLHHHLAQALERAEAAGDIRIARSGLDAPAFIELLWSSISGQKQPATSISDFRERVRTVTSIFMASITQGGDL